MSYLCLFQFQLFLLIHINFILFFNSEYQSTFDFPEITVSHCLKWNLYFRNLVLFIEFMLGEDILVAPVIVEGATSRNIYLPAGLWRDENNPGKSPLPGRTWLINYPAGLEVLPWFTKISSERPSEPSSSDCHMSSASYVFVLGLIAYFIRWDALWYHWVKVT